MHKKQKNSARSALGLSALLFLVIAALCFAGLINSLIAAFSGTDPADILFLEDAGKYFWFGVGSIMAAIGFVFAYLLTPKSSKPQGLPITRADPLSQMPAAKFTNLDFGEQTPFDYGNIYFQEPCGNASRLVIGPSGNHVQLLEKLARCLKGEPWYSLYVLLIPRLNKREPGRYQSQPFYEFKDVSSFLDSFRSFFEGDGRHHIWIGSAQNDGMIIYDQHNVLFAYGPIAEFESILKQEGFSEEKFWFPAPHSHAYNAEYDGEEDRLMTEIDWEHFPLQDQDTWA